MYENSGEIFLNVHLFITQIILHILRYQNLGNTTLVHIILLKVLTEICENWRWGDVIRGESYTNYSAQGGGKIERKRKVLHSNSLAGRQTELEEEKIKGYHGQPEFILQLALPRLPPQPLQQPLNLLLQVFALHSMCRPSSKNICVTPHHSQTERQI